ncbi:MAG: glycosyltransferase [Candidatus Edwardsbacteria bacterium]|nr:glycosyltransferase [Candidatus Edwardsbacteria bacterium]
MKILFVCPYLPYPMISGGHTRVYNLITLLSRRHRVNLAAYSRGAVSDEQRKMLGAITERLSTVPRPTIWHPGNFLQYLFSRDPLMHVFNGRSRELSAAIERQIREWGPDIVHVEHFHTAGCLLSAPSARSRPLVIGEQGVEYVILERLAAISPNPVKKMLARMEHRRVKSFELMTCRLFDCCIEVSDDDRKTVERDGLDIPVRVVPNGVDSDYFRPTPLPRGEPAIMFIGTFTFFGNRDAARWLLDRVWPGIRQKRPDALMYIVGNKPPSWLTARRDDRVIVTGLVPDIREYITKASLIVCPVRIGSGTKLKILEAMACGRPVITTTMGLEGITAVEGQEAIVRDDPDSFRKSILELLGDPDRAAAIGGAARRLIEQHYSWERSVGQLTDAYQETIETRKGHSK